MEIVVCQKTATVCKQYINAYVHTYVNTHIHTYINTCIQAYIPLMQVRVSVSSFQPD